MPGSAAPIAGGVAAKVGVGESPGLSARTQLTQEASDTEHDAVRPKASTTDESTGSEVEGISDIALRVRIASLSDDLGGVSHMPAGSSANTDRLVRSGLPHVGWIRVSLHHLESTFTETDIPSRPCISICL